MKTFALIFLGIVGAMFQLSAQHLVQIEFNYMNLDAKWLADLNAKADNDGVFHKGKTVSQEGKPTTNSSMQEYKTSQDHNFIPVVDCGVKLSLTPRIKNGKILMTGMSLLRRPLKVKADGTASQFEAKETYIDLKLENGLEKEVALGGGAKIIIKANLIDSTGLPIDLPIKK